MAQTHGEIHRVPASPQNIRWGSFDAAFPPVLEVASGGLVVLDCVSGPPEVMLPPGSSMTVPEPLRAIHAANPPRLGPHLLTGPVAVKGAEPGDVLRVDIERIELGADWGFCGFRPLGGTLPVDFPYKRVLHIPVDRATNTCRVPVGPGITLPLSPFFGVMGVAPPGRVGRHLDQGTARARRQPRQQGAARGRDPVPARPRRRRDVLRR